MSTGDNQFAPHYGAERRALPYGRGSDRGQWYKPYQAYNSLVANIQDDSLIADAPRELDSVEVFEHRLHHAA